MVDRNAEALAQQLLSWPTSDRARLATLLLASIEPVETDADVAWDAEIDRRSADVEIGVVQSIPANQVFAEIDRRLGR